MQFRDAPQELIDILVERVREGCPITAVCDSLHIARSVYYLWMEKGKQPDNEPYTSFRDRVRGAKGDFLCDCVTAIKDCGRKQWQAHAWLLERKDPEHFSEKYMRKKYPEHLAELPFDKQGNEIFGMMLKGEISQYEAHMFIQILADKAKVEENIELKREIFEIKEKQK